MILVVVFSWCMGWSGGSKTVSLISAVVMDSRLCPAEIVDRSVHM